jgi:hypothetical protein
MVLPGGRYSCAQVLASRLPFLSPFPLGQVCHIVQLAISQKKLLGYLNGSVVPYKHSQSMLKEQCAQRQRPSSSGGKAAGLATWQMLRSFLQMTFASMDGAVAECVPLSNVKRLFRTRHRVELSETALGHAKLSELMRDPRVSDLCSVRLQNHGYAVFPPQQARASAAAAAAAARHGDKGLRSPLIMRQRPKSLQLDAIAALGQAETDSCCDAVCKEDSSSCRSPDDQQHAAELTFPPTPEALTPRRLPSSVSGESLPTLLRSCAATTSDPGLKGSASCQGCPTKPERPISENGPEEYVSAARVA